MNMGKKKWAILLIIALVIGTGSYVFANPSLDSSKDTLNPNHSVNPESNQNKENNTNGNVDVANSQDVLNIEDLEAMNVPSEEAQILEQMIMNNDTNAVINVPNETGTTTGNVVNTLPNNENSGIGTTIPENNSGSNTNNGGTNNNNPGYIPPGNTGSSENTGSNPSTGNNTGSGNSGSTGSGTTQGGNTGTGTDVNPGNPGDNTGSGTGNTGESNNPNPTNPSETPSFVFANDESFTNNTIVINDPNYDHMVVYNLNTRGRVEVYETEYTIDVEYAVYIFIVFNKDGSYQGYKMYHTKAEQ